MSATFDFTGLVPVTDHRDADLLDILNRIETLRDQVEVAKRRGKTAYERAIRRTCHESVELQERAAATSARTPGGRHAKAMAALRNMDPDPDQPSGGFHGFSALVGSALYDIVQAGGL